MEAMARMAGDAATWLYAQARAAEAAGHPDSALRQQRQGDRWLLLAASERVGDSVEVRAALVCDILDHVGDA